MSASDSGVAGRGARRRPDVTCHPRPPRACHQRRNWRNSWIGPSACHAQPSYAFSAKSLVDRGQILVKPGGCHAQASSPKSLRGL